VAEANDDRGKQCNRDYSLTLRPTKRHRGNSNGHRNWNSDSAETDAGEEIWPAEVLKILQDLRGNESYSAHESDASQQCA
jgi:hypothetical protein